MKKVLVLLMLLTLALPLAACHDAGLDVYVFDTRNYIEATTDVAPTASVDEINVDWVAGNIRVVEAAQSGVTAHETAIGAAAAAVHMCYRVSGSTLSIAFAKNGTFVRKISKDLTITVPQGTLAKLNVDTVASNVTVNADVSGKLDVDLASGAVYADLKRIDMVDVDTASGSVTLNTTYAKTVRIDTASGVVNCSFKQMFDKLEVDTGSGNVTITMPRDASFTMKADTGSGRISTGDFPCTISGNRYNVGTRAAEIDVDTGSGNITLKAQQ